MPREKPMDPATLTILRRIDAAPAYTDDLTLADPGSVHRNRIKAKGLATARRASFGRWLWELTPRGRAFLDQHQELPL